MECERCGKCCQTIRLTPDLENLDLDTVNVDHKQYTMIKKLFEPIGEWDDGAIKYKCRMLYIDDNEKAHCMIYESRPSVCRRYTPGEGHSCKVTLDKE